MKDIVERLAGRSCTGDLYVNLAEMYLREHEWGFALRAIERGMHKGQLSDPEAARDLRTRIGRLLGLNDRDDHARETHRLDRETRGKPA